VQKLLAPGVPWRHGAMRHSFSSYRLADVKSAAQVALEVGNSPQMIFQHYRELVTEKGARAWFGITPEAAKALKAKLDKEREAKIMKFPATAAAWGCDTGAGGATGPPSRISAGQRLIIHSLLLAAFAWGLLGNSRTNRSRTFRQVSGSLR
jgi:hypothetical protein